MVILDFHCIFVNISDCWISNIDLKRDSVVVDPNIILKLQSAST